MFKPSNPRNFLVLALLSVALVFVAARENTDDATSAAAEATQIQAAGMWLPPVALIPAEAGADDEASELGARGMNGILLEASKFLDHDQMTKLVELLAEQRPQWQSRGPACDQPRGGRHDFQGCRRGMSGGHGPGHGPGHAQGFRQGPGEGILEYADELGLTEEQVAKLEELRAQKRSERREARVGEWQERAMERQAQRVEFLTQVLGLSEEQRTKVESVMAGQHDELQALGEEFRKGLGDERPTPDQREAHRAAMEEIRGESRAAILKLLDDDQVKLFEALENLRPEPRGRQGGRGRGR